MLVVVGLIIRAVSIEYRHRRSAPRWKRRWDVGIAVASALLPFLFGVFWAGLLQGAPLGPNGPEQVTGLEIITPYSILGGVVLLSFSLAHGAVFLALKTRDDIEHKARRAAIWLIMTAGASMTAFAIWTYFSYSREDVTALVFGLLSVLALAAAQWGIWTGRFGIAFVANGLAVLGYTATIFLALAPNAVPSSIDPAYDLTLSAAAAGDYPLTVMTVVAVIALPVVLLYQGWSFWVFRARVRKA
jgi:cytochrome d ubiquinol oxidase subunit II